MDLRKSFPLPYNQGKLQTCTACSIASVARYYDPSFIPSRLYLYYNNRMISETKKDDERDIGVLDMNAYIDALHQYGMIDESLWDYDESKVNTKPSPNLYHIGQIYLQINSPTIIPIEYRDIKSYLNRGIPIIASIWTFQNLYRVRSDGMLQLPHETDQLIGLHNVVMVGYDDSRELYIMRNHWGPSWGDNGYFYIPYRYIAPETIFASDRSVKNKLPDVDFYIFEIKNKKEYYKQMSAPPQCPLNTPAPIQDWSDNVDKLTQAAGGSQVCSKSASDYATSASASFKEQANVAIASESLAGQVSGTNTDHTNSESGCKQVQINAANIANASKNMSCLLNSNSSESDVDISMVNSINITCAALSVDEQKYLNDQLQLISTNESVQQAALSQQNTDAFTRIDKYVNDQNAALMSNPAYANNTDFLMKMSQQNADNADIQRSKLQDFIKKRNVEISNDCQKQRDALQKIYSRDLSISQLRIKQGITGKIRICNQLSGQLATDAVNQAKFLARTAAVNAAQNKYGSDAGTIPSTAISDMNQKIDNEINTSQLNNIIQKVQSGLSANNNLTITALSGNLDIKDTEYDQNIALDIVIKSVVTSAMETGQKAFSEADIKTSTDTTSKTTSDGVDKLIAALGEANKKAIDANANAVGGISSAMLIVGGYALSQQRGINLIIWLFVIALIILLVWYLGYFSFDSIFSLFGLHKISDKSGKSEKSKPAGISTPSRGAPDLLSSGSSGFVLTDPDGNLTTTTDYLTVDPSGKLSAKGDVSAGSSLQSANHINLLHNVSADPSAHQWIIYHPSADGGGLEKNALNFYEYSNGAVLGQPFKISSGGDVSVGRNLSVGQSIKVGNTTLSEQDIINIKSGNFPILTTNQISINHSGEPIILNTVNGDTTAVIRFRQNGINYQWLGTGSDGTPWNGKYGQIGWN